MTKGTHHWTISGMPSVRPPAQGVHGLSVDDLGVVFQPIVEMATGAILAHEALVRCKRPEYTAPPTLFEHAVREEACGRLGRMIRDVAFSTCGDVALFVNIHPAELASRWLVRPDDPIGFQERTVYLEITESATFTHYELCTSVLKELCARTGALLVVDDFGAGYSNLDRLAELEPAVVKLDMALIRGIHLQRRKQIVARHMVNLCKELGARVVAEGVETLDELKCVRDLGVDLVQGYLIARPAARPPSYTWPLSTVSPERSRLPAYGTSLPAGPALRPESASRTRVAPAVPPDKLGRAKSLPPARTSVAPARKSVAPRASVPPRKSQRPPRSRR